MTFAQTSRLLALSAIGAFAAVRLAAQGAAPAAVAADLPAPSLVTYVQLAPPQILAKDIMGIARQVAPGMQTEMMPLFILGRYGYPTFPGVSTQSPVMVLVFDGPGGQGVVFGIQMTADSPVRSALASMHLAMQVDAATGWTFLSPNPDLLASAQAHAADYVKLAGQPITGDLVLTLPTSNLTFLRTQFQTLMQAQAATTGSGLPPGSQKWIDLGFQELQQAQYIQIGLDLKPDTITLTSTAVAQPGTPMAQYFSAPVGGPVPSASYISANSAISVVIHDNMPASQAFADRLFADAEAIAGPQGKQLLTQLQQAADSYFAQADGSVAEGFSLVGTSGFQGQALAGGNITNDTLVKFLQSMYPQLATALLQRTNAAGGNLFLSNVTLNLNVGNVSTIPVHEVVNERTVNTAAISAVPNAAKRAALLANLSTTGNQTTDMYFSAVNGYYGSATSLTDISTLVQAVQAGQPVPNNLAGKFTLTPGELLVGQLDIGQLAASFLQQINPSGNAAATLRAANLPPAAFSSTRGAGQSQFQLSIPVASIVGVVQATRPPAPAAPAGATGVTIAPSSGNAPGPSAYPASHPVTAPAPSSSAPGN